MANFEKVVEPLTPDQIQPQKITNFQKSSNIFGTTELTTLLCYSMLTRQLLDALAS